MQEVTALIDKQNKVVMDWSTKCGCTILTKMFFRKMGLLDEALAYNPWIHEYRMRVFKPDHPTTIDDLGNKEYYKFKVVRNPFGRVVSSYIRIMLNEHIQEDLRRFSWNRSTNISFDRFLDYLETIDLLKSDPHQAYQKKFYEFEPGIQFDQVIKLEQLDAGIADLNKTTGLNYELAGLTSHHHHEIRADQSITVAGKKWSRFRNNLPPYHNFYNEELRNRVLRIYAEDFSTYGYTWEEFIA